MGDCWFTLAALEHEPGERARVHELIRQAGGRIFDAKRINLVASTSSTYAVCPLGFPPPRLAEVMRQTDFKMGEVNINVSFCYYLDSRLKPAEYHKLLWKVHLCKAPLCVQCQTSIASHPTGWS